MGKNLNRIGEDLFYKQAIGEVEDASPLNIMAVLDELEEEVLASATPDPTKFKAIKQAKLEYILSLKNRPQKKRKNKRKITEVRDDAQSNTLLGFVDQYQEKKQSSDTD